MKLEMPMAFSKTTKRKIVFATDDGLAPYFERLLANRVPGVTGYRDEVDSRDHCGYSLL